MKYYLSYNLLSELLFGKEESKKKIEAELSVLIKTNSSLFTSVTAVEKMLSFEQLRKKSKVFLNQITILCDRIISFEIEDCALCERLFDEYEGERETLLEFSICIRENIDCFLTTCEVKIDQRLISVKRIALESV